VKDKKTVDAVVRNLEIIGEASKHIPESVRKNYQCSLERYGWDER
jgi:uncharacterized protein with HEPN domain